MIYDMTETAWCRAREGLGAPRGPQNRSEADRAGGVHTDPVAFMSETGRSAARERDGLVHGTGGRHFGEG